MIDRPPDTGFIPINPNPFIVGNPVRGRAMFFGRETEFELVRRRFQHSTRGGLLVFCGERRSGKTSILFQIMDGRLGPEFIPVLIDMQSMAVGNETEFLTRISEEVVGALGSEGSGIALPGFTGGASHSATFQKFAWDVLKNHPGKKLILLFDEYELFEDKIDAGLLGPDVLHVLASLMERHPVFLVFTGSQHLEQRRREYWKILGKSQYKMISFLERGDALSLIRAPVEGRVRYAEDAVETIWRLTAGQPFYTQAICQSLVDLLNERRTNDATRELVSDVVDGIVNNPLPQMIFMWDGLQRDEKLVLALLAEQLAEEGACAGEDDLLRLQSRRQYPRLLDRARVATTLERLFKSELLLRNDRGNRREYAFRMDLWRLWIRRQHSVWQVMRELGEDIRPPSRRRVIAGILLGAAAILIVIAVARGLAGRGRGHGPPGPQVASIALEVSPDNASIVLDGQKVGSGFYRGSISTERDYSFQLSAAGFADTVIGVRLAPGDSSHHRVTLRELLGDLRIVTRPTGAQVKLDGAVVGQSPLTIPGLSGARPHVVEAVLVGHGAAKQEVVVTPGTLVPVNLVLSTIKTEVLVTTDPAGCQIEVDGEARGVSPLTIRDLPLGSHTFSASKTGYIPTRRTVAVTEQTAPLSLSLDAVPLGTLEVKGNRPVEIWIDDVLVAPNLQYGQRRLPPGPHQVRVIFADGRTKAIDQTVEVRSRERSVYDFSTGAINYLPERGP